MQCGCGAQLGAIGPIGIRLALNDIYHFQEFYFHSIIEDIYIQFDQIAPVMYKDNSYYYKNLKQNLARRLTTRNAKYFNPSD